MPTSDASCISTIICEVMRLRPARVLDVGPGYGKYGFLCREYLPELELLDAVEPWPHPLMCSELYNTVYASTWPEVSLRYASMEEGRDPYDVVLMIDVIEHYPWGDGVSALLAALSVSPVVLVSTPHRPAPQGTVGGNVFEAHVSQWTIEMFFQLAGARTTLLAEHGEQLMLRLERA